tara:strand:- start:1191 stop:2297 length:1107 start_codon:yes stop_codon:yes gene_type:complete
MFEITLNKQELLQPLLTVAGAVDKKQSLAILANILIKLNDDKAYLTATDLEIEMTAVLPCESSQNAGAITVPAKKFVDIIRSLEDAACPKIIVEDSKVALKSGRSRFKLATLPADGYPNSEDEQSDFELQLPREKLLQLFQSTHFAMSQQDVRVFLNGLLLEVEPTELKAVATDGHRMAIAKLPFETGQQSQKLLIPRKGILEVMRLLSNIGDEHVTISAGKNHFKLITNQYKFVSKLIESKFPPYNKAIPKAQDKQVWIDKEQLKRALSRIIILANEKSRAVLLDLQPNQLTLIAHNQEQEEAQEIIEAQTEGDPLKIGMNAVYLQDVLSYIQGPRLKMSLKDSESSILVESEQDDNFLYIIMPMKI